MKMKKTKKVISKLSLESLNPIQACLTSILLYYLSMFRIPIRVEGAIRKFLWIKIEKEHRDLVN